MHKLYKYSAIFYNFENFLFLIYCSADYADTKLSILYRALLLKFLNLWQFEHAVHLKLAFLLNCLYLALSLACLLPFLLIWPGLCRLLFSAPTFLSLFRPPMLKSLSLAFLRLVLSFAKMILAESMILMEQMLQQPL